VKTVRDVFSDERILITGGTGSLGKTLVNRLLSGKNGAPEKIIIFSRDEAKQHFMRVDFLNKKAATDEVIYSNFQRVVEFRIGDVRDQESLTVAARDATMVINAAALKQVPSCEYFVEEAVRTNILGPCNLARAIAGTGVRTVIGVSTDKACKPVNAMGATKAIQEKVFIAANIGSSARFALVRYGNVLASRGSVIPLFHEQIRKGGPVTITTRDMTRFLLPLERAVDTIVTAATHANEGEIFVPIVPSAKVVDIAHALIGPRKMDINEIGIRPGEKVDEILISEVETPRTKKLTALSPSGAERHQYYAIQPSLPELKGDDDVGWHMSVQEPYDLGGEYSSASLVMTAEETSKMLEENDLLRIEKREGEMLK